MVEAANLLQIVFSRGQKHATPISFGASKSNNRFIGGIFNQLGDLYPDNLEISISLDSSGSTIPSFRFRPLLRASHQLRPRKVIAGGLRADRKTSIKPGTGHSGGKIYHYEIPSHVLTMGAYPNTKMMTIPTGSTYFI